MSVFAQRAICLAASAAIAVGTTSVPATAQDSGATLNILVECAKIDEPSARLACYDNNMRSASGITRSTVPGSVAVSGGGAAVGANAASSAGFGGANVRRNREAAGFGGDSIRTAERFQAPSGAQSVTATIASARLREPGMYLMTMEDDTQWLFAETVRNDFTAPRKGEKVVIERGALGSYLARVEGQEPVRVRRVR